VSIVLILAVGQDSLLLDTRSSILRAAGYVVESAFTLAQAINEFERGDFDMVLLCHSMPLQDRDRLTCAIRASGSRVPVVVVAPVSQECARGFADALLENNPISLVQGVEKALRHGAISRKPTETVGTGHFG
jgi:CheY-like chemotaxis protein